MSLIAEKNSLISLEFSYNKNKNTSILESFPVNRQNWAYLGKIFLSARHYINAALRTKILGNLDGVAKSNVVKGINQLKLFNVVTFMYSLDGVKTAADNFFRSLEIGSKEAIALTALTFTLLTVDMVDTLNTIYTGVLYLGELGASQLAASLDLPLATTLSVLGMLVKGIQVYKEVQLKNQINDLAKNSSNNFQNLRNFLIDMIGDNDESSISRENKMSALKRFLSPEIIEEMRLVVKGCHVERNLPNLVQRINNKIVFDALNGFASFLVLGAVVSFTATVPAALPFIFLGTSMVVRIAALSNFEHKNSLIS